MMPSNPCGGGYDHMGKRSSNGVNNTLPSGLSAATTIAAKLKAATMVAIRREISKSASPIRAANANRLEANEKKVIPRLSLLAGGLNRESNQQDAADDDCGVGWSWPAFAN